MRTQLDYTYLFCSNVHIKFARNQECIRKKSYMCELRYLNYFLDDIFQNIDSDYTTSVNSFNLNFKVYIQSRKTCIYKYNTQANSNR